MKIKKLFSLALLSTCIFTTTGIAITENNNINIIETQEDSSSIIYTELGQTYETTAVYYIETSESFDFGGTDTLYYSFDGGLTWFEASTWATTDSDSGKNEYLMRIDLLNSATGYQNYVVTWKINDVTQIEQSVNSNFEPYYVSPNMDTWLEGGEVNSFPYWIPITVTLAITIPLVGFGGYYYWKKSKSK